MDTTPGHMRNSLVPNQALGAGIDRLSQQTIDTTFVKPVIDRVLEAGWGPVTYRQNAELYTEAWHWNPKGNGVIREVKVISLAMQILRR